MSNQLVGSRVGKDLIPEILLEAFDGRDTDTGSVRFAEKINRNTVLVKKNKLKKYGL